MEAIIAKLRLNRKKHLRTLEKVTAAARLRKYQPAKFRARARNQNKGRND